LDHTVRGMPRQSASPLRSCVVLVPQGSPDRRPIGPGPLFSYYNYGSTYLSPGVLLRPMASVTTRPPDDPGLAKVAPETIALPLPSAPATVRIEPPRGWLELHL